MKSFKKKQLVVNLGLGAALMTIAGSFALAHSHSHSHSDSSSSEESLRGNSIEKRSYRNDEGSREYYDQYEDYDLADSQEGSDESLSDSSMDEEERWLRQLSQSGSFDLHFNCGDSTVNEDLEVEHFVKYAASKADFSLVASFELERGQSINGLPSSFQGNYRYHIDNSHSVRVENRLNGQDFGLLAIGVLFPENGQNYLIEGLDPVYGGGAVNFEITPAGRVTNKYIMRVFKGDSEDIAFIPVERVDNGRYRFSETQPFVGATFIGNSATCTIKKYQPTTLNSESSSSESDSFERSDLASSSSSESSSSESDSFEGSDLASSSSSESSSSESDSLERSGAASSSSSESSSSESDSFDGSDLASSSSSESSSSESDSLERSGVASSSSSESASSESDSFERSDLASSSSESPDPSLNEISVNGF